MNTELLNWQDIQKAAKILKKGGVVVFPTETVYGIGCIAGNQEAFDRLVAAKKRPADKPFTLMCANLSQVAMYCEIDNGVRAIAQKFMPGEVTLLLQARAKTHPTIDLGTGVIGVRIPDDSNVRALIEAVGKPLLVTSANISGDPAAKDFEAAKAIFEGAVDAIVDGKCRSGQPSTIVSLVENGVPKTIREGSVSADLMADVYRNSHFTVAIGSDHGGYKFKEAIKRHLVERGYEVLDCGTSSKASCDYPIFGIAAAKSVVSGAAVLGVVVCTSGEGICMAANKVPGARCGLGYDDVATGKTREHNDANLIAFGQKYMRLSDVLRRVDIFLIEKFSPEEKHHRRVDLMN